MDKGEPEKDCAPRSSALPRVDSKSTQFQEFKDGWADSYKEHFGYDYRFNGVRDQKAAIGLIGAFGTVADALAVAREAWGKSGPRFFYCEKAVTIQGLNHHLNQIRRELGQKMTPETTVSSNPWDGATTDAKFDPSKFKNGVCMGAPW